jgi:hypothetical protein
MREQGAANIAVVTDHTAMVTGQRRPLSGKGGFGKSFKLNGFFKELYTAGFAQVFSSPAKKKTQMARPSGANRLGDPFTVREVTDFLFPDLRTFTHPYGEAPSGPWWNK